MVEVEAGPGPGAFPWRKRDRGPVRGGGEHRLTAGLKITRRALSPIRALVRQQRERIISDGSHYHYKHAVDQQRQLVTLYC